MCEYINIRSVALASQINFNKIMIMSEYVIIKVLEYVPHLSLLARNLRGYYYRFDVTFVAINIIYEPNAHII